MKNGKAGQNREKQEWAKEKPKFDNARRLRGIYLFDPEDENYKETLNSARRKLERPMAPAMPCIRMDKLQMASRKCFAKSEIASEKTPKTVYGCIVESHESTRHRVDHIAGK